MKTGLLANEPVQIKRLNDPNQRSQGIQEKAEVEAPTAIVSIQGSQYLVDFGQGSRPRFHKVSKNKECSCAEPTCEAIEAVRQYLQSGGMRAPDPEGMPACPICGSKTYRDRTWDGKYTRTLGWRCQNGGLRHFLEAKAVKIKQQLAGNPG